MRKFDSFGHYLNKYLTVYLPGDRGLATNSILSYRDTFSLLILFLKTEKQLRPENLPMAFLTRDLIIEFAAWLENARDCSLSSRNQRLVVLRTFCKWLAYENPGFLKLSEDVCDMRLKKAPKTTMSYLSAEAMQCLLSQPDSSTREGHRDLTLLALTYDTGARVSEIIDLRFKDIRLEAPPIAKLTGKGNKTRIVPLLPQTVKYLTVYIARWQIDVAESQQQFVFTNRCGERFTRAGIKYVLDKHTTAARLSKPHLFPDKISPHSLRHSKAMHMLQAGVNIVYIRDVLGHADLSTTERYARADTKMKRDALIKSEILMPMAVVEIPEPPLVSTTHSVDDDMSEWLRAFGTT